MVGDKQLEEQYEAWLREEAENQRIDSENSAKIHARNEEWIKQWPNYCTHCKGWGMFVSSQSVPYGMGSASFDVTDPCEALPVNTCHRCGAADGLDDDGNGPCKHCNWSCDDGLLVD